MAGNNVQRMEISFNTRDRHLFERLVKGVERMNGKTETPKSYPRKDGDYTILGPELFTGPDELVISWKGENFYKACNAKVKDSPYGSATYCVKRVDHPRPNEHEDYLGNVPTGFASD